MKLRLLLLFYIFQNFIILFSQQDTVYYDANSGNYIIQYIEKLPYAQKNDGTMRKLTYEDELSNDEEYIEIDSLVIFEFQPATKIEPFISAKISKDTLTNRFVFNYSISNGINSEQKLNYFSLIFDSDSVESINNVDTWWNRRQKIIQDGEFSNSNFWLWSADQGLDRGWFNSGFIISASGLPRINNSYFQGASPEFGYTGSIPNSKVTEELSYLNTFPTNYIVKKTISPGGIPSPFIHDSFIDSLQNYITQSLDLTWIKDEATYYKYNSFLIRAKVALEQGDTNSTRTNLQSIITNVELDSSTSLTSEAYALLKFNTEYLLEQLPEINIEDMFNTLINYVKNCYEQSWINNKGILNSLTKKVENAKKDYLRGKIKPSKNKLNSFNNEVEAQKNKHLNEDCYNLLIDYSNFILQKLN